MGQPGPNELKFERNEFDGCLLKELVKTNSVLRSGGNRRVRRLLTMLIASAAVAGATARASEPDARRDATVEAIEKALPSVVNIATTRIVEYRDPYQDLFLRFYGRRAPVERREDPEGIGSGVIIDEEGYILTNFHVLRRASRVYVKLDDGRVIEADPLVFTTHKDVALLKLRSKPGTKFPAIRLAKDDDLLLGETVLALGNPYGLGTAVTRGILSSKARRPVEDNEPLSTQDWLQTDADINPGNSGGPLINLRGELIGINVAVYREAQGMGVGFAIPVKQISSALVEFFAPEITDGLWFGAGVTGLRSPLTIAGVQAGSPAEKAGLRVGQRILQVNGETPRGLVDFNRLLSKDQNHTARLEVQEGTRRQVMNVGLVPFDDLIRQKLGMELLNLTPQTAARFQVNQGEGLFIEKVERNGPADKAQLQSGFLLTAVDGQPTGDQVRVALALSQKKAGDRVRLTVVVPRRVGNSYVEFRQGMAEVLVR
jgi:S1-C subfamily serine protease